VERDGGGIEQHAAREIGVVAVEQRAAIDGGRTAQHARAGCVRVHQAGDVVTTHIELQRGRLVGQPFIAGDRRPERAPRSEQRLPHLGCALGVGWRVKLAGIEQCLRDTRQPTGIAHPPFLPAERLEYRASLATLQPLRQPQQPIGRR
jgi:hypothetical protein